ncbi:MAG: DinB family protein [Candidatus Heimdallarchaeota archaeon]
MSVEMTDMRNIKDLSIDSLEIAECNLLLSIKGIQPEDVNKQLFPEINAISWIIGHCADQLDSFFGLWCQGKRILTEQQHDLFRYGASKETVKEALPLSFGEIINNYLRISDACFSFLKGLSEDEFRNVPRDHPSHLNQESLFQLIQRASLHFMGHMGQILVIRRALGNPGLSFVSGLDKVQREKILNSWKNWWDENKAKFV